MAMINANYAKLKGSYLFAHIKERVQAYSAAHPEKRLLRLGIGDVTQPLTPSVIRALHEAADAQSDQKTFHGYVAECGEPDLRSLIAGRYRQKGADIAEDEVFVSSGASDELSDILDLFDSSLKAMVIEPAYPAYADACVMEGREIVFVKAEEEKGFVPEPPEYQGPFLIYLCSPNNPTGAAFSYGMLEKWVEYANKTDSVILFDAAYEAYVTDADIPKSIFKIPGAETCAIEICSLSKTAGFTGTRCGYTVIPKDLERDGMNLNAMWVRNRTTRTNGVSWVIQHAAAAVFSEEGRVETEKLVSLYRKNAQLFMESLDQAGIWYAGRKNSPYIWAKCPAGMSSWEFFDMLLHKAQIIATPGSGFGESGEGYMRFSMFADPDDIREAGRRIVNMQNENVS